MKKFLPLFFVILIATGCLNASQVFSKFAATVSSDSLADIEALLSPVVNRAFAELEIPGIIVGVIVGDAKPWVTSIGVSDIITKEPINVDDKMRIGSITKTFTNTVLLQLIDEGKVGIDDPLSKYFPDYPNGDNITIRQLANMTSGLFNYSDDVEWQNNMLANLNHAFTPLELIEVSRQHAPNFPPGEKFEYSNTNTIILGLIIEKITGNSLQNEIQKRILVPLGMNETYFALDETFPEPHSKGYYWFDTSAVQPADVTNLNPSWAWAAGSMISTMGDLLNYAKPLATGGLVSKKSQEDRLTWGAPAVYPPSGPWKDKEILYGFGICSFDGAIGHNGGIPGYNSFMAYLPEKDATIIILANIQFNKREIGPADYIAGKIMDTLRSN